MIPAIGLMIGAYIFTRMVEIMNQEAATGAAKFCAVITMIVVAIAVYDLLTTAQRVPI